MGEHLYTITKYQEIFWSFVDDAFTGSWHKDGKSLLSRRQQPSTLILKQLVLLKFGGALVEKLIRSIEILDILQNSTQDNTCVDALRICEI